MSVGLGLDLVFLYVCLDFYHLVCFLVQLKNYFLHVFCFRCVRFSFFGTMPRGWLEERLPNNRLCVKWDVKP